MSKIKRTMYMISTNMNIKWPRTGWHAVKINLSIIKIRTNRNIQLVSPKVNCKNYHKRHKEKRKNKNKPKYKIKVKKQKTKNKTKQNKK